MIEEIGYYISDSFCPYHNLSLEELLADSLHENQAILYLWQNADTVVIGKHQNAYLECNYDLMSKESINLARRRTGGGAVFHDKKNLNFTFINKRKDYDLAKNQAIIRQAVESFGLQCQTSGRNDITHNGRKFSGNAYLRSKDYCIHHGTIMLDVDISKLERYLNVDRTKLINKGIKSVRSRVVNLKSVAPHISIDKLKQALIQAFNNVYALCSMTINLAQINKNIPERLTELRKLYASKEFLFDNYPIILARQRRPYGEIIIAEVDKVWTIFSDCLDVDLIDYTKSELRAGKKQITDTVEFSAEQEQIINDINQMLVEVKQCRG